jgi:rubrerythrin
MSKEALKEILKRAIRMEEDSHALYTSASGRLKDPAARAVLADLASQEVQHKQKLEALLAGTLSWLKAGGDLAHKGLGIGDHLEAQPLSEGSSLQDVLIYAIKREEATGSFYSQMATLARPGPEKDLFELLARQEAGHKSALERVYETVVYKEF